MSDKKMFSEIHRQALANTFGGRELMDILVNYNDYKIVKMDNDYFCHRVLDSLQKDHYKVSILVVYNWREDEKWIEVSIGIYAINTITEELQTNKDISGEEIIVQHKHEPSKNREDLYFKKISEVESSKEGLLVKVETSGDNKHEKEFIFDITDDHSQQCPLFLGIDNLKIAEEIKKELKREGKFKKMMIIDQMALPEKGWLWLIVSDPKEEKVMLYRIEESGFILRLESYCYNGSRYPVKLMQMDEESYKRGLIRVKFSNGKIIGIGW